MAEQNVTYIWVSSEDEQKAISILMVLSAALSAVGSSCIIYHVRQSSKTTPYRRIMLGMSVCDIISTIGYALQPYVSLSGEATSFVWSFGNAASCSFIGALVQFGFSAHLYSAALSFYFLATIRHGTREIAFAKKYERWIHGAIFVWSIATAIVGMALDVFHLSDIGPGCWVSGVIFGECTGFRCWAELIAWILGGIPLVLSFFSILINNLLLYFYVRQTVREGQRKALENERRLTSYGNHNEGQEGPVDGAKEKSGLNKKSSVLASSEKQWKRVREVGKQSFLYVGAYLFSYTWTIVKQNLDAQQFERSPGSGTYLLPLSILQAMFLPAQGLFNALIFFRPKYKQARRRHAEQSKLWSARRAVFGDTIRPVETKTIDPMSRGSASRTSLGPKRINFAGEVVSRQSSVLADVPEKTPLPTEDQQMMSK